MKKQQKLVRKIQIITKVSLLLLLFLSVKCIPYSILRYIYVCCCFCHSFLFYGVTHIHTYAYICTHTYPISYIRRMPYLNLISRKQSKSETIRKESKVSKKESIFFGQPNFQILLQIISIDFVRYLSREKFKLRFIELKKIVNIFKLKPKSYNDISNDS